MVEATDSICQLLSRESALAARLIRAQQVPVPWLKWLSDPTNAEPCEESTYSQSLLRAMQEVLTPISADAKGWEQKEIKHAAAWYAFGLAWLVKRYQQHDAGFGNRLLAGCLLPLYRCLATGRVSEGFEQSRFRVSEAVALVTLCEVFGRDLKTLLERTSQLNQSPHEVLLDQLDVDLVLVGQLLRSCHTGFDGTGEFDSQATERFASSSREQSAQATLAWAEPDLLWRLAGELIAPKTNILLPRSWIETPVPWGSVGDHWNSLERLFVQATSMYRAAQLTPEPPGQSASQSPDGINPELTCSTQETAGEEELRIYSEESSMSNVSSLPKVLIAEIRSPNDPAFVRIIQRRIATCRKEACSMALAMIVVSPENEADYHEICGSREDGLALWQQKLVNWLSDHPEVSDPSAFLTSDSELVLCLMGLERNEVSTLVRQGLVEVLTGKHFDTFVESSLAMVKIPARFHVGIASTSKPAAGFSPEKLIGPSMRCLAAASNLGNASIKSIEVF